MVNRERRRGKEGGDVDSNRPLRAPLTPHFIFRTAVVKSTLGSVLTTESVGIHRVLCLLICQR